MWDFSWLTDLGKGGSYENIEQRVAEVDNTLQSIASLHICYKRALYLLRGTIREKH